MSGDDRVQEVIEALVQWDAFKEIWGTSTPREKYYVRELLARALKDEEHVRELVGIIEALEHRLGDPE